MSVLKILQGAASGTGHRMPDLWRDLLELTASALAPRRADPTHPHGSVSIRETDYMQVIEKHDDPGLIQQLVNAHQALVQTYQEGERFADHLGPLNMDMIAGDQSRAGEFYTPASVSSMTAHLILDDEPPAAGKVVRVHEPAAGAGVMILELARAVTQRWGQPPTCLEVQAWDISRSAVNMTMINTTLWAIPTEIVWGNTLTLEVWASWRNVLWPLRHAPLREGPSPTVEECSVLPEPARGVVQPGLFEGAA